MDTTIAIWRDLEEELVGEIDCTFSAFWASVENGRGVRIAIVGDVDCLTAMWVLIRVDAIGHVDGVDGDEVLGVGTGNAA